LADLQCGKSSSLAPEASWSLNFRSETHFFPHRRSGQRNAISLEHKKPWKPSNIETILWKIPNGPLASENI
jgi:Sec7-like guanine-nucleotide exchange factor